MNRIIFSILALIATNIASAGEPYYLVSRGFLDASVISVYGYPDNRKPCQFLENQINQTMAEEKNYHKFSCVDAASAMAIDCAETKDKNRCEKIWTTRNTLLEALE